MTMTVDQAIEVSRIVANNCGTGGGGFKPGNKCGGKKGGGGSGGGKGGGRSMPSAGSSPTSTEVKSILGKTFKVKSVETDKASNSAMVTVAGLEWEVKDKLLDTGWKQPKTGSEWKKSNYKLSIGGQQASGGPSKTYMFVSKNG